ncbi:MAG: 23S rRNA (pseudouridine(1915)-N(3))-methyltransferase RlmH [Gammaproteobacteria bacterium]
MSLIAVAARTPRWLSAQEADYASRLSRFRFDARTVKPETPSKTAAAVLAKAPRHAPLYLLDCAGKAMDSESFARWLQARLEEPYPPAFVIGGADGLPAPLRKAAAGMVSLSPLTFAHAAARFIFAEQLFRADCILRGHPYPK